MTAVQSDSYVCERSTYASWETYPADELISIDVLADHFENIRGEQEMFVRAGSAEADLIDCLATWFNV
jgi:hypothetical protein